MDCSILHLNAGTIAGLLSFLLFFYYLSRKSISVAKTKPPPEAAGAWPIIGHLYLLGGPQLPHVVFGAIADKHGPIFTVRLGIRRALVVSSPELAKEIFTTNDLAVSSRPKFIASKYLGYDYAMFGFSPYGPYWRELRKLISMELLSARRLELLKHIRISETETSIRELRNLWNEKKNGSGFALIEMKQWFGDLTLNVILRMVSGKRYYGTIAVSDEKEARRCQKVMREFFYLTGAFVVADNLPFLGWLDIGGYEKAMKAAGKEIDAIVSGWLEEHRRNRKLGKDGGHHDFMDVMLSLLEQEGTNLSGYDADTITKSTCLALITGGTDTTAVMLTWAFSLLLNNRHALRKAQEELDTLVGKQRRVNESDIDNLIYLQAIVKETLRLYPAGPLSGYREFSEDCTIGGYHVSKGTRLILNLWKLQRDPKIWSEPLQFKPERFLDEHKALDVKGQNFELIPFGAGRRICPGINFGLQMLHLVLANLIHAFELSTPSDEAVDMTEGAGLTSIKATPLDVLLAPRLSPHLY